MADISEPAPIPALPSNDKRRPETRPKKDDHPPDEQPDETSPDAEISDVTTIMGIPADEMTPKVQEVLSSLMAQFDKLRNELQAANAHNQYLEQLAEQHPYLPVVNRRGLHRELSRMLALGERAEINNTFVFFHVRNIEDIRRRHGHSAAEAGLTWAAERLAEQIRDADVLGGMGGHDFGVILTLSAGDDASAKAAGLARAVEADAFHAAGETLSLEIAYGMHTFEAEDTAETVIDKADDDLLRRERESIPPV
ncbi:MAG: GGDEF domain-containing protein [Alphaproteobacteria bacterium]